MPSSGRSQAVQCAASTKEEAETCPLIRLAFGQPPSPQGEGLRAGEGTRPYGMCRSVLSFRRGRTLAGPPRNGTQLSRAAQCAAPTQIPERSQTNPRAHTVRPYGVIRTGTVGSSKPGAGVEPHRLQFLQTQGPVAREEPLTATQILRAGRILPDLRGIPVMGVRG